MRILLYPASIVVAVPPTTATAVPAVAELKYISRVLTETPNILVG